VDASPPNQILMGSYGMTKWIQITSTTASREEAQSMAHVLIERHLAGCVQIIGPIHSVYRWQDEIEQANEWQLIIKTSRQRYAEVEQAILELHSYECPEIIATPIEAGSEPYLQWLRGATENGESGS
jgi:periplasmic divalent cation tolerance protein